MSTGSRSALLVLPLLVASLACDERSSPSADAATPDARQAAATGGTPGAAPPSPADVVEGPDGVRARVVVRGVDLTGIGYDVGRPDAPIQVVELSDFGCRFCASFATETEPRLMREFVDPGHVYWKYVPFVIGMFPNGDAAARAAECMAAQGKFWPMKDSLYAAQGQWKGERDPEPLLRELASGAGGDAERFASCYAAGEGRDRTQRANAAAARLGVRATPTFFINGQMVEGALPITVFRGGLRQMLRDLGATPGGS